MEPVPETERMEEFRSSPLPTPRLQQPAPLIINSSDPARKPPYVRRSTEPSSPSSPSWVSASMSLPYRPRTTSPLSGMHARSKSTSLTVPSMGRTRSMPGLDGAGRIIYPPLVRPSNPSRSPSRTRTPRKPADESFPQTPLYVHPCWMPRGDTANEAAHRFWACRPQALCLTIVSLPPPDTHRTHALVRRPHFPERL